MRSIGPKDSSFLTRSKVCNLPFSHGPQASTTFYQPQTRNLYRLNRRSLPGLANPLTSSGGHYDSFPSPREAGWREGEGYGSRRNSYGTSMNGSGHGT